MIYGTTEFNIVRGSLSTVKGNRTEVREYPGLNKADYFDLGKIPTRIGFEAIAESQSEKLLLESLFHTPAKRKLIIQNTGEYYKDVINDGEFDVNPWQDTNTGHYIIPVRMIALDPVPYGVTTDEVMY